MTRMVSLFAATLLLQMHAQSALAQSKQITGEKVTITATVEAIDHGNRVLTLKDSKGEYHEVDIPATVKRFDEIKVGDTLTATYYDNIVVRLKTAGEQDVNTAALSATPSDSSTRGGTVAKQRTITATIVAIDPSVPSISFKGPNGWAYSSRVEDRDALKQVRVGDKVDITWTEAVLVSFDLPKK
jgi:hypothetical protein